MPSTATPPWLPCCSSSKETERSRPSCACLVIVAIAGAPPTLLTFFAIDRWRGLFVALMALGLVAGLEHVGLTKKLWRTIGWISNNEQLSIAVVSLSALVTSAMCSWYLPPLANIADEFAYIYGADTFLSGRLTNPTHPMWRHFEPLMVISVPTSSSKYPPAQSIVLAAGKYLTGTYIAGVWISYTLACASLCWMLQGWTTRRWAFTGGLFAALHPSMQGGLFLQMRPVWRAIYLNFPLDAHQYMWSWSQSYWGGAVAMTGGCLLYGALPRVRQDPNPTNAFIMATGLLILANSRPFEGMVASIPAAIVLLRWLASTIARDNGQLPIRRFLLPLTTSTLLGIACMAGYNLAVTGNALRMPYQEYADQYDSAPMFVFQKPAALTQYRNEDFRYLYMDWHSRAHESQQHFMGWLSSRPNWFISPLVFFVGPMAFAMLWIPAALRRGSAKTAFVSFSLLILIHQLVIATVPHYIAPGACLIIVVITACMRELSVVTIGGRRIGRACVLYLMMLVPICLAIVAVKRKHVPSYYNRNEIQQRLEATDGQHLAFVESCTKPDRAYTFGWISNHPDIDRSKVVWAYDLGPVMNQELLDYFKGRKIWRVDAQGQSPHLIEYEPESRSDSAE